ncbi:hypothetical protein C1645_778601 [Glomus cerebriforme]|uniref:Serine-threonine/tyrosine-protein kinase catalytic domain-containing protein n=1 Tax=Glomus cerebriforme TaxID=658196 RepID=A0A397SPL9_9GLOM|nr:hypothetical protein C1645_778601 [Glomus cerebriforme]
MIMYFAATGKQPFYDRDYDELLVLDICKGIRPEINEPKAPKCYIDLMKRCWDLNMNNRPNAIEIEELINVFYDAYISDESDVTSVEKVQQYREIKEQIKEAEEYRKAEEHLSSIENESTTDSQSKCVSHLLNSYTEGLPKYNSNDDCLDCEI